MKNLSSFMQDESLDWPITLKPDVGERGQGVAVIKNATQAESYLTHCHEEVIAQEYIEGIYYVRMPDDKKGKLFSVSCKHPQKLKGDDIKNIEHLILEDPRAVTMARFYLRKFASRLDEIPTDGEEVVLAEIGPHARGALFTDDRKKSPLT